MRARESSLGRALWRGQRRGHGQRGQVAWNGFIAAGRAKGVRLGMHGQAREHPVMILPPRRFVASLEYEHRTVRRAESPFAAITGGRRGEVASFGITDIDRAVHVRGMASVTCIAVVHCIHR